MSTGLHTQLDEAIRARLETARVAMGLGQWAFFGWGAAADEATAERVAAHTRANDPATVIRMCLRDLAVLERHAVCVECGTHYPPHPPRCHRCNLPQPCSEITDLAVAYGLLDPTAGE